MRIAFAGTPDFAVPCLNALSNAGVDLLAVYTQPDRPAGRGRNLRACAVKRAAIDLGIPVRQPATLDEETDFLKAGKVDLLIVVAYGVILRRPSLLAPRLGCVNVHASLLPRWRGAAPIQRAIAAGDSQTGISLMQMDEGLDTGPVLAHVSLPIHADDTGQSLHDRLSVLGATLLTTSLDAISSGQLDPAPQALQGATYAHQLSRSESWINWDQRAIQIERSVRAFDPWPLTRSTLNGNVLLIRAAREAGRGQNAPTGTVVAIESDRIQVQASDGLIDILKLQKPGGKVLLVRDFLNGFSLREGDQFCSGPPGNADG
ncbi:MAG: methionyl-tRNA formyltransferase [Arenicellales bacterium]